MASHSQVACRRRRRRSRRAPSTARRGGGAQPWSGRVRGERPHGDGLARSRCRRCWCPRCWRRRCSEVAVVRSSRTGTVRPGVVDERDACTVRRRTRRARRRRSSRRRRVVEEERGVAGARRPPSRGDVPARRRRPSLAVAVHHAHATPSRRARARVTTATATRHARRARRRARARTARSDPPSSLGRPRSHDLRAQLVERFSADTVTGTAERPGRRSVRWPRACTDDAVLRAWPCAAWTALHVHGSASGVAEQAPSGRPGPVAARQARRPGVAHQRVDPTTRPRGAVTRTIADLDCPGYSAARSSGTRPRRRHARTSPTEPGPRCHGRRARPRGVGRRAPHEEERDGHDRR